MAELGPSSPTSEVGSNRAIESLNENNEQWLLFEIQIKQMHELIKSLNTPSVNSDARSWCGV